MIFKILGCGTSTGVPLPGCECRVCTSADPKNFRTRTSALLRIDGRTNILIDAGPDFRMQALAARISSLSAVLFTHSHADHIFGIDDLKTINFIQKASIPCYGSLATLSGIRKTFSYIFDPKVRFEGGMKPQLDLHEIEETTPFVAGGITIQPFPLVHGSMQVTGYRFGNLAYATDCNQIPDVSREILKGVRTLILDGLRQEPHSTHFTIAQAIEVADSLGVERTLLTHMTHSVDYAETSANLPKHVALAYDGLEIEF